MVISKLRLVQNERSVWAPIKLPISISPDIETNCISVNLMMSQHQLISHCNRLMKLQMCRICNCS